MKKFVKIIFETFFYLFVFGLAILPLLVFYYVISGFIFKYDLHWDIILYILMINLALLVLTVIAGLIYSKVDPEEWERKFSAPDKKEAGEGEEWECGTCGGYGWYRDGYGTNAGGGRCPHCDGKVYR